MILNIGFPRLAQLVDCTIYDAILKKNRTKALTILIRLLISEKMPNVHAFLAVIFVRAKYSIHGLV